MGYCIRALVLSAVVCTAASAPASAQETVNFASVSGRVVDPQGAIVRGATVAARHIETNVTATTTTDAEGRFRFPYLRIGPYEITASRPGFADATQALTLTLGAAYELPLMLGLGGVTASVTVSAQGTVLETARSQIAGTIAQAEVQSLPMNGRNFLDLALLVPGVSPANIGTTQLFAETSAVMGQGISVNSQRNLSNGFIVDGLSANDDAAGLSGIPYGVDAIEQVQVVTSGGQAELGRALGGYVNIVTRSGTNTRRGTVYGFFRDDALNAANALSGTKLPMNQQQYGVSLGGAIVPDRTFYFANVEQRRLNQTGLSTIAPDAVALINERLAAAGYPGARVSTGVYPNPVRSANVLAKLDHQFSGSDHVSVRYAAYRVTADNARGAGALNAPTASTGLDNTDHSIAVGNTWTLSDRTVNETRVQLGHGDLKAPPSDPIGPAVNIAGVASFGTSSGSPTRRVNTMYQFVDNISHQAGAHALRAGIDIVYNDDTITYPRAARGSYTFASLDHFMRGDYNGFSQTFGDPVVSQTSPNIGVYAQDEWKIGESLTLNLGLRYDVQFLDPIETDTNNVSPRVGFAWSPLASRDLVIRGSGGLYFDRVPLRPVANAILSAGNTTDPGNLHQPGVAGLLPTQTGAPVFPGILQERLLTTTLVDFTTMDRNLQNAYSKQAAIEVERILAPGTTISAGYQYLRGGNLIMLVNRNVPTCVAAGANNGCRPDPRYRNNNQYSSVGESNYHGLHVSFVQRPTAWAGLRVSYTLSKSMNNVGQTFFSSPVDPGDINRDWARSDDDQRHRLAINGTIRTPEARAATVWEHLTHGLQISGTLLSYSSLPFNITSGVQSLQGTTGRPFADGTTAAANFDVRTANLIPRNAGTGNDFFTVNLRVSRVFRVGGSARLEGMVEVFNLTDRVNPITRNANFGPGAYPADPAPGFNRITAVGDPRTLQLGLRLTF